MARTGELYLRCKMDAAVECGYPWQSEFRLHVGSFHLCAFFVSCESVVFAGQNVIAFGLRVFLSIGLKHLFL